MPPPARAQGRSGGRGQAGRGAAAPPLGVPSHIVQHHGVQQPHAYGGAHPQAGGYHHPQHAGWQQHHHGAHPHHLHQLHHPGPAAPTPATSTTEAEDGEEPQEADIITGAQPGQQLKIRLSKRTYLLGALVLITGLCIAGVVFAFRRIQTHGHPPTFYASECSKSAFSSLVALIILSPVGFFILRFRITNLLIGLAYLFLLVFCIIFPIKSVLNGTIFLQGEEDSSLNQFVASEADPHRLHKFWAFYQGEGKCCGTREIDRVEDWSSLLLSHDIPSSCCTKDHLDFFSKKFKNATRDSCGKGLARTRGRWVLPVEDRFPRLHSGFYLSLSDKQVARLRDVLHVFVVDESSEVLQAEIGSTDSFYRTALEAFNRTWRSLYVDERCNRLYYFKVCNDSRGQLPALGEGPTFDELHIPSWNPSACDIDNITLGENDMWFEPEWNTNPRTTRRFPFALGVITDMGKVNETCVKSDGWIKRCRELNRTRGQPATNPDDGTDNDPNNDHPYTVLGPKKFLDLTEAQFCEKSVPRDRENMTTMGRRLLLFFDYLSTYLEERKQGDEDEPQTLSFTGSKKQKKEKTMIVSWTLWRVPTVDGSELYPFQLTANLKRIAQPKRMYYISQGISENYVLDNIIHPEPCGKRKNDSVFWPKLARDLNRRFIIYGKLPTWKNPDAGLGEYFLAFVRDIVYLAMLVSIFCVTFIIVIAFVFWQYYSRIKAEEYANLALPKEFDVLHLQRGSLIDAAEIHYEIQKRRVAHKGAVRKKRAGGGRVAPFQGQGGRPPLPGAFAGGPR